MSSCWLDSPARPAGAVLSARAWGSNNRRNCEPIAGAAQCDTVQLQGIPATAVPSSRFCGRDCAVKSLHAVLLSGNASKGSGNASKGSGSARKRQWEGKEREWERKQRQWKHKQKAVETQAKAVETQAKGSGNASKGSGNASKGSGNASKGTWAVRRPGRALGSAVPRRWRPCWRPGHCRRRCRAGQPRRPAPLGSKGFSQPPAGRRGRSAPAEKNKGTVLGQGSPPFLEVLLSFLTCRCARHSWKPWRLWFLASASRCFTANGWSSSHPVAGAVPSGTGGPPKTLSMAEKKGTVLEQESPPFLEVLLSFLTCPWREGPRSGRGHCMSTALFRS